VSAPSAPAGRAAELIASLGLAPHPEGGWYREVFRSSRRVTPHDGRDSRSALTHIDFLLAAGQASAWHRVRSDEVWQLLEGGPLRLWLMPPTLDEVAAVTLGGGTPPRHVVAAHWWQAAEPLGAFAYVGATVVPGFEFTDFDFMRAHPVPCAALQRLDPALARLL
jgi:predicted cupin superfamily sugar epimerase